MSNNRREQSSQISSIIDCQYAYASFRSVVPRACANDREEAVNG